MSFFNTTLFIQPSLKCVWNVLTSNTVSCQSRQTPKVDYYERNENFNLSECGRDPVSNNSDNNNEDNNRGNRIENGKNQNRNGEQTKSRNILQDRHSDSPVDLGSWILVKLFTVSEYTRPQIVR